MSDATAVSKLADALAKSKSAVFFGGAGVSTESGIPDFRSESGLYHAKEVYGYPPETLLSASCLKRHPELFFRYYRENLLHTEAKPNAAHLALAKLEAEGKIAAIVTQNIDGLHQAAGSKRVYELHGSIWRNYCVKCGQEYPLEFVADAADPVPHCTKPGCGGMVRPDVVLYGEGLDDAVVHGAIAAIAAADLLIVGGTSLAVYPAAGLVDFFHGYPLVIINKTPTDLDQHADIVIAEPIGEVFDQVMAKLGEE